MVRRLSAREVFTTVSWIVAALGPGILLSSLFVSTNLTVRFATIAVCALAVARPDDAMLAAAALIGFGDILGHLSGVPTLRAEEAIVVATLFGWSVRGI